MPTYVETDYSRGMKTGLVEAWKLADKIADLPASELFMLFGCPSINNVFRLFDVFEAKKIMDSEEVKSIKYNTILEVIEDMELSEDELKEFLRQLHEKYN